MKLPRLSGKMFGTVYEDVKSFSFLNDITGFFGGDKSSGNNSSGSTSSPSQNNNNALNVPTIGGMSLMTILILILMVSLLRK